MKQGKSSQSNQYNNGNYLANLQRIQKQIDIELKEIERKIFQDETQYLKESLQFGAITKGWDGPGNQQKSTIGHQGGRKSAKFTQIDRLFSYSSKSAPVTEEETKNYDNGSAMSKFKGLTLGKANKLNDKVGANQRDRGTSQNIINKSSSRRSKKTPGSIRDLSNVDSDRDMNMSALNGSATDFISDNEDMKEEDEDEDDEQESSNYDQDDSDN